MPARPPKSTRTWPWFVLGAFALFLFAIPSLWVFMSFTAPTLHPDPQSIPAQSLPTPSHSALPYARQLVRAHLAQRNLPALSVAVAAQGDILWSEAFGYADLEQRLPATPQHRFQLGTASIPFTSVALGLLLDQGKIHLDDEIQKYVPAFPRHAAPITLRHLMSHTAGLRFDGGDENPLYGLHCPHPVDALPVFASLPLDSPPGAHFRFSTYGWILLGAVVESASGQPFYTFLQEKIFTPLGMRDTLPDSLTQPIPQRATPYFPRFAADPIYGLHLLRAVDHSCYAGTSGLLTTPTDLVRFTLALQQGKLLSPATLRLLQSNQRLSTGEKAGQETNYGLGWDLERIPLAGQTVTSVGHDGEIIGGMSTSLLTIPSHGLSIAVLSNISYADTFSLASSLASSLAPAFAGSTKP